MTADPIISKLASVPLFAELGKRDLQELARTGTEVELRPGEPVVRQGKLGTDFYTILSGEVEVTIDGERITMLGPGDHFGELSAITGVPRSASVTAVDRVFALRLTAEDLRRFLEGHGPAAFRVLQVACRRLQEAAGSPTS